MQDRLRDRCRTKAHPTARIRISLLRVEPRTRHGRRVWLTSVDAFRAYGRTLMIVGSDLPKFSGKFASLATVGGAKNVPGVVARAM